MVHPTRHRDRRNLLEVLVVGAPAATPGIQRAQRWRVFLGKRIEAKGDKRVQVHDARQADFLQAAEVSQKREVRRG